MINAMNSFGLIGLIFQGLLLSLAINYIQNYLKPVINVARATYNIFEGFFNFTSYIVDNFSNEVTAEAATNKVKDSMKTYFGL